MKKFQLITSIEEFNLLKNEWNDLVEAHPKPQIFISHDWIRCWIETFVEKNSLLIYIYRVDSKIKFIAPLMKGRRIYLQKISRKSIHFLGIDRSDSHDFIYAPGYEVLIPELINMLILQYPKVILNFDSIIEDSPSLKVLNEYKPLKGTINKVKNSLIPYILLNEMPAKSIKKKNILRSKKHMQQKGKIELKKITDPLDIEKFLPILFEQHKQKWKNSQYNQNSNREFYQKIAYMLNDLGYLEFTVFLFEKASIAMHFGFSFKGRYYYFKPTFDFDFAHYSPGNVLLIDLIKQAKDRDFTIFDFGKGEEAYKFRYTKNTNILYNYSFYPQTLSNLSLFRLIKIIKKFQ